MLIGTVRWWPAPIIVGWLIVIVLEWKMWLVSRLMRTYNSKKKLYSNISNYTHKKKKIFKMTWSKRIFKMTSISVRPTRKE